LRRRFFDLPYVLLTLTALFWSGNFIVARAVHADVPPMGLVFWRWFGAMIVVLPFAWRHIKADWPVIRAHWRIIFALAAIGVASFNTLVYLGLQSTTALNAVLLQSAIPICIVIFAYVMFRDTVRPLQAAGIALSLAGVMTIVARGDIAAIHGLAFNQGDLLVFAAVVLWAIYSVLLRKRPEIHPLSFLTLTIIISVILLAPLYAWEHLSGRVTRFDVTTLLAVGYVAIFPSVLAYTFYNRGVDLIGANRAGTFIHLMPLFGSIMAILFLGESFHLYHALGIALILGGLSLAARPRP
jgi:drug/metabolite transporter (DMT)-like permease